MGSAERKKPQTEKSTSKVAASSSLVEVSSSRSIILKPHIVNRESDFNDENDIGTLDVQEFVSDDQDDCQIVYTSFSSTFKNSRQSVTTGEKRKLNLTVNYKVDDFVRKMGFKRSSSVATDIEVVKNHELDLSTYKRIYRQFDDAFKQEYAELSTKFLSNAIVQDFATELLINTEKDCVIAGTNDFAYVYVICNRKKREEALKHPNEASRVYELFKSIVYFGTVLNRSLENRRRQHGDAHFPPADFQLLCVDQLTKEALPQELNDVSKWVLLNEFILATFRDFYTLRDQNSRAGVYHLTHMMYNQFYIDECQKVRLRVDLSIKLLTSMLCGSAVSAIQRQKAQRYQLPSTTVVTTNAAYMSTINEIVNQGPHIQLPLDEYHRVQTLGAYVIVCRAELAIARSMEMSSEKLKLLLSSVHYFGVVCANSFAFRLYEHRLTAFNGDFDMIPLSCLLFGEQDEDFLSVADNIIATEFAMESFRASYTQTNLTGAGLLNAAQKPLYHRHEILSAANSDFRSKTLTTMLSALMYGDVVNSSSSYLCVYRNCSYSAFGRRSVLDHMRRDHEFEVKHLINGYVCTKCNRSCFSIFDLKKHDDEQHSNRIYTCLICSATFATKAKYDNHVQNKHSSPTECRSLTCDLRFNSQRAEYRHFVRAHTDRTVCVFCARRLRSTDGKKEHELICKRRP